MGLLLTNFGIL